jgi:site-specific DNA-methyltransferase (adenine-specific)
MKPYYQDDAVTIYHGDCREVDAWLTADVLVTDPPYGIAWKRSANPARLSRPHDGIANDEDTSARDAVLDAWGNKPAVVFGSFYAPPPHNIRQVLVWRKGDTQGVVGSTTGFRRDAEPVFLVGEWPTRTCAWSSVLASQRGSWNDELAATGHPHTKPIDLMRTLVTRTPTGVIADPFMGSGSTLRAAKDVGRKAIGVELDERYCEIAAKRMAQEVLDFGAL